MVANVNEARYTVELWDHEKGDWSLTLAAAERMGEPSTGLTWRGIGVALRTLRSAGWEDDTSIHVKREDEPMAKKAKQQYLGDTEPEYIQEIVTAAETYKSKRDKRMAMTEQELETRTTLLEVMKKHNLTTYKFNGQIVTLIPGVDKVKVKAVEVDGKGIDE